MPATCEWAAFASGTTPGVKMIVKAAAIAAVVTAAIAFAVMDLNMYPPGWADNPLEAERFRIYLIRKNKDDGVIRIYLKLLNDFNK